MSSPGSAADYREGQLEVAPGVSLFHRSWTASTARTPLVIVHGIGEHSGRYEHVALRFLASGYNVHLLDLPGHGRSPGPRGHLDLARTIEWLHEFVVYVSDEHAGARPVLLAHSMGGLIATCYAAAHQEAIRALVLSSPLWGFTVRVTWWKRALARALRHVWPSLTLRRPRAGGEALSHDPDVVRRFHADPLVHLCASVQLYMDICDAIDALPAVLRRLTLPVLILQAGADLLASPAAVHERFPLIASPHKGLIVYDGFYHEVFNEVDKETVFRDVLTWLERVVHVPDAPAS